MEEVDVVDPATGMVAGKTKKYARLDKALQARGSLNTQQEFIEFGVVQKYNRNKGFGFIDCVFVDRTKVNTAGYKERLFVYHHEIES